MYVSSGWILCVGALLRLEGCPYVGFGLESAFSSVRLALESLVFTWFASGGSGMWRRRRRLGSNTCCYAHSTPQSDIHKFHYQLLAQSFYIYYIKHVHVSVIYPGHLQGAASLIDFLQLTVYTANIYQLVTP
jgi:hypothetical protein